MREIWLKAKRKCKLAFEVLRFLCFQKEEFSLRSTGRTHTNLVVRMKLANQCMMHSTPIDRRVRSVFISFDFFQMILRELYRIQSRMFLSKTNRVIEAFLLAVNAKLPSFQYQENARPVVLDGHWANRQMLTLLIKFGYYLFQMLHLLEPFEFWTVLALFGCCF